MTLRVGSDPEVILINAAGKHISAVGLIGGSKRHPKPTTHGFVQEDNVLVEFNPAPSATADEFVMNTLNMLTDIHDLLVPLELGVDISSSCLFDSDQLKHFKATVAGCEPDFNAWTGTENDPPDLAATNLRTCGGHLHISFDQANESETSRTDLVRVLDLIAGVPSVLMDRDVQRRSLYGKAGACRPKDTFNGDAYDGVEYRVLSNFWLQSEQHMRWAFTRVQQGVENMQHWLAIANEESQSIFQALNNSDLDVAQHLVNKYSLEAVNA